MVRISRANFSFPLMIIFSRISKAYKRMTLELQRVDLSKLSREERLAFFVNTYNALVIHGNVEKGTPSNLFQRYKFFANTAYNIGGFVSTATIGCKILY